jgi:hypothetical protein
LARSSKSTVGFFVLCAVGVGWVVFDRSCSNDSAFMPFTHYGAPPAEPPAPIPEDPAKRVKERAHVKDVARYRAMTPPERAAIVEKLCPPRRCPPGLEPPLTTDQILAGDDECCSRTQLDALVESTTGGEATRLRTAVDDVERRHDTAKGAAGRSASPK